MNLSSRIFTYLVGIAIGSLLVYIMLFRGRSDRNLGGWLPNERVLAKIKENPLSYTEKGACMLNCFGITEEEFKEFLSGANVAFGKSETSRKPCPVYLINATINEMPAELSIEVCDSLSNLVHIKTDALPCDC